MEQIVVVHVMAPDFIMDIILILNLFFVIDGRYFEPVVNIC